MNVTIPFCIMMIQIAIIITLTVLFIKYRKRIHGKEIPMGIIHPNTSRIFNIVRLLLIASPFPLIAFYYQYFVIKNPLNSVVLICFFAEYYAMFFAVLAMDTYERLDENTRSEK